MALQLWLWKHLTSQSAVGILATPICHRPGQPSHTILSLQQLQQAVNQFVTPTLTHARVSYDAMYSCGPCFSLVPAGESGVGKSTFIHNLVSGFKVAQPGSVNREGGTTMKQFKADPNSLLTVLAPLDAPDSNQRLHITVQVSHRCTLTVHAIEHAGARSVTHLVTRFGHCCVRDHPEHAACSAEH